MEHKLIFVTNQRQIMAADGALISEAMHNAGVHLDSPCGGKGTCGKCTVVIAGADGVKRTVLACQTEVRESLTVWEQAENKEARILIDGEKGSDAAGDPRVICKSVEIAPCVIGEKASISDKLNESLGMKAVSDSITLAQLSRVQGRKLEVVYSPDMILDICSERLAIYTAAFDIGTTTIAGYLLNESGAVIATAGRLNPQTEYGADVISRVDYTMEHGTKTLTDSVRAAINDMLGQLCRSIGIETTNVYSISIVGNTCMHHLFLGLVPASLGKAPFSPVIREKMVMRASAVDIHAAEGAELILLPVIAGFIGADTVACAIAEEFDRVEQKTLLIDIGTNGELIMGTKDRMIACSTAAGPAFEGAKISMGMRGMDGAIDHVYRDETGAIRAHVIGECEAIGICGSGLVDAVSVLLDEEIIDETGRMEEDHYQFAGTNVTITQKDIREIQLAKAAISAGIQLMAEQLGWTLEDIDRVLIAGAFGNYMDSNSACDIGLIPEELRGKIRGIGNAAGEGAQRVLRDGRMIERASQLADRIEFLELATLKNFQDTFVDALCFGDWED